MRYLATFLFMAAGLGLLAVNTGNNLAEINRTAFALDTSAVIVGLAVMSALLSLSVVPIWRLSRPTALLAGVIVLGCMITSVRLTTDRIGGVDDTGRQISRNTNGRIARADQAIAALSKKIEAQRPVAGRECRGYVEGRSSPKLWPKCLTARSLISDYETKLEATQAERGTLGEKVTEARHSERFLTWIAGTRAGTAATMVQPVLIATLLEIGTALLLSISGLFASNARRHTVIDLKPVTLDPVLAVLQRGPLSNRELAKRLGWSEAKTSRQVALRERAGDLNAVRKGKVKLIALA